MTDQTNAALIAEARLWPRDGVNEGRLVNSLADALEAAEQERDEARKAAEDHVLDADAVHVRLSAELREVNQERDNWKMSAEEAERAEKRWKGRAEEAERERDRLDEAFDRDLPWRYDEVEAHRNRLAAVVEKVWQIVNSATAPDGALHEHYAALVKGMVDECAGSGREQTHGVTSMLSFLYTKARRKREEQTDV